jgi:hypothetical protein
MSLLLPFQPAAADYPNHLASPGPERLGVAPARWTLALLLALCLIPRAVIALRTPCIVGDGVVYVNAARAIEAHDARGALWEGGINIYPAILAAFHRLGVDWETAAALWGVTAATLIVLPLWGWVRRQFDDRVALVACLLYIVHPRLIVESPEVMRDPTFWLFFMLAIYWLWRAVTEVRLGWFLAAGVAITLASLTRVEGLFLLTPLALWTFWRWRALAERRWKLLAGAALCVLAFPLLLLLINVIWLHGHSQWTMMRVSPLARVRPWIEFMLGYGAVAQDGAAADKSQLLGQMIWRFFPTFTRGLSPVFALLMFGGIWGWFRVWSRRDHQPLFYVAVLVLGGAWIQIWAETYLHNINTRYALPIVLMAAPLAALGLLALAARVLRFIENRGWPAAVQRAGLALVAAVVLVPSVLDVAHNNVSQTRARRTMVAVGRWASQMSSAPPTIVGPWDILANVGYYAGGGPCFKYRYDESDEAILDLVARNKADLVLLRPSRQMPSERCESLAARIATMGFKPLCADALPGAKEPWRMLVRSDWLRSAGRPAQRQ